MTASIGWVATAAFAVSYLFKNPGILRRVQALAAGLWILYGFAVGAWPVVVANAVVATMAVVYPWIRDQLAANRRNVVSSDDAVADEAFGEFRSVEEIGRAINADHPTLEPLCLSIYYSSPSLPITSHAGLATSSAW